MAGLRSARIRVMRQIERGVSNPSLLVLIKISSVLKVELVDLLNKN